MNNAAATPLAYRAPSVRRLRVFAFDPGVSAQLETVSISELTLQLAWEENGFGVGPVGEYIEVVDYDPASGVFYAPVDLNHPYILAQDGLPATEGIPQFHQQMVYAVAMRTIDHFERALGRVALWAHRIIRDDEGRVVATQYVPRLRIYPHALREANAYYSPQKKALLFGYFPTRDSAPGQMPGGMVFTCLSFDIVAHETTHALLDGLHPSFNEATNADVHALHEGFADIVALLQRFAHPEILEHQIARTRGNLERQHLLGELAQQFGQALGMRRALRSAIGKVNPQTGQWEPRKPDPSELSRTHEPHERGGILVAAVFAAFLAIYKARSADLFRIASNGTGVLAEGEIHPDLVGRLAREAADAADVVLTMCIRGLDYCPPVDIDFGTYLRGIITADAEVYPIDQYNCRVAFIEAFRSWGIYPDGVRSLSESELRYPRMEEDFESDRAGLTTPTDREYVQKSAKQLFKQTSSSEQTRERPADAVNPFGAIELDWDLTADREQVWHTMQRNAQLVHAWLTKGPPRQHLHAFGLTVDENAPPSVYRDRDGSPSIEVHSVRVARRRGRRGNLITDLVVEVRQRRRGFFDPAVQQQIDSGGSRPTHDKREFRFRRGCTLIIDPAEQRIRYVIATRGNVADDQELDRVRQFLANEQALVDNAFYGPPAADAAGEPFAALHRRHPSSATEF